MSNEDRERAAQERTRAEARDFIFYCSDSGAWRPVPVMPLVNAGLADKPSPFYLPLHSGPRLILARPTPEIGP